MYRLSSSIFAVFSWIVLLKSGFTTDVEFKYMVVGFLLIIISLLFNICGMIEERKP
jgi:hypothetical protein